MSIVSLGNKKESDPLKEDTTRRKHLSISIQIFGDQLGYLLKNVLITCRKWLMISQKTFGYSFLKRSDLFELSRSKNNNRKADRNAGEISMMWHNGWLERWWKRIVVCFQILGGVKLFLLKLLLNLVFWLISHPQLPLKNDTGRGLI